MILCSRRDLPLLALSQVHLPHLKRTGIPAVSSVIGQSRGVAGGDGMCEEVDEALAL